MKNEIVLVCKSIKYYSHKDEDAFFEWIKKINCIKSIKGIGDELHLYIASDNLHDYDLRDLLGLFYRYNVKMTQLQRFLNEENKSWFYENRKSYWHKKVFDSKKND